mgnify:CR=1 FL=1
MRNKKIKHYSENKKIIFNKQDNYETNYKKLNSNLIARRQPIFKLNS